MGGVVARVELDRLAKVRRGLLVRKTVLAGPRETSAGQIRLRQIRVERERLFTLRGCLRTPDTIRILFERLLRVSRREGRVSHRETRIQRHGPFEERNRF